MSRTSIWVDGDGDELRGAVAVSVRFVWYDLWIGAYVDRSARAIYVCPLPCVLFTLRLGKRVAPSISPPSTHTSDGSPKSTESAAGDFVDLGCGLKLPANTEAEWERIDAESIKLGIIPPRTRGHDKAYDEGRPCPDRFCGCRYTFDGERVVRIDSTENGGES